ncbi:MAG: hypothetical protein HRU38_18925 [Saccharospirillaceae bacterium]|nr:hypothetical protein [Pseudomonadales bacterium]NRB80709.1 hypothetical protein [Saccharospirillaceae bacterium]
MKATLLCALVLPVLLSACSSFPRSFIPDPPKLDEYGTFNAHGFSTSTCVNKDKNIYITMNDQVISIEPNKLINANIVTDTDEQRVLKVEALLASENINSLGCKENPFPANEVWLTTDFKKLGQSFFKHFYAIRAIKQDLKEHYAFIEKSITAANQLPNCKVNDGVKICQSVETRSLNSNEERQVIYRTWMNNSITHPSGAAITERCVLPNNDNEFDLGTLCTVNGVLPTGFMFDVHYLDNIPSDHIEAVDVYKVYLAHAIELTQK